MICSKSKLDNKMRFISDTHCNNGCPEGIVWSVIGNKINDFNKIKPEIDQKCPVYQQLHWLVEMNDRFTG